MPLSAFEDHFGKNTCLKSLGEKAGTAPEHQTAQGTTHAPGGGQGQQAGTSKQAGGKTAEEKQHKLSSAGTTRATKYTRGGGGSGRGQQARAQPKASQNETKQRENKKREKGQTKGGCGGAKAKGKKPRHHKKKGQRGGKKRGGGQHGAKAEDKAGNKWVEREMRSAKAKRTPGRKPKKAKHSEGASKEEQGDKRKIKGGARGSGADKGKHGAPGPKAPGAGKHKKPETAGAKATGERGKTRKAKKTKKTKTKGQPQPGGGGTEKMDETARGKVRRTKARPGGRPAPPGQEERAHSHTHGTWLWCPGT